MLTRPEEDVARRTDATRWKRLMLQLKIPHLVGWSFPMSVNKWMRNGHIKLLILDSLHHFIWEIVVLFNLVFTFFRKEKWLQIKLVLPSFAFILLLQPQEGLSSHAADDQGQAHVCTSPHVSVLVLQIKSLSIFSHPTQSYLAPPPHLSSACDAVTSFLASSDAVLSPTAKEIPKKFSADCSPPYVPPG